MEGSYSGQMNDPFVNPWNVGEIEDANDVMSVVGNLVFTAF